MAEKWFDELPEDAFSSESERIYMTALKAVKAGLAQGYDFDRASATIQIQDEQVRQAVLDDVLKVIIAELHFTKRIPLDQLSRALNLPSERLEKACAEMMEDIEKSAVTAFYDDMEKGTEQ